ncbi:MAG: TonB-dependent receptor plug domain-containing protein, partial [Pseudomonadales bacterium]
LNTDYDVLNTRLKLANENWSFSLSSWQNRDAGNGAGSSQALDPIGSTDATFYQFFAAHNGSFNEDWNYEARFYTSFYEEENDFVILPAGTIVPIGADGNLFTGLQPVIFPDGVLGTPGGKEKTNSLEFINHYSGFNQHNVRLSVGYRLMESDVNESKNFGPGVIDGSEGVVDGSLTDVSDTPFVFSSDLDRNIKYVSLQDEWTFARDWELTVGLRYDDYSDFGSTINPRLALVWATNYNLTSKLLYGRAFRAPSIGEQFQKNNPIILGNSNIDPETIDTIEIAFDFRPNASTATKLNLFAYEVSDLIDFVPSREFQGAFQADNAIDQIGYGFEIEYEVELSSDLDLHGNYSWQRSEDKDSDEPVADAPGQQFYLGINWRLRQNWYLSGQLNWVADRERGPNDQRPELDDYFSVDMTLRKQLWAKNFEAALVAYNLFDENIHEPSAFNNAFGSNVIEDFPMQGRRVSLELRYKFSN